ncbi:MAG: RCC1 domain-containing protein [Sandaracinaceae bacterium]
MRSRVAMIVVASIATGCWDWDALEPVGGSCEDVTCPCPGDACMDGECVPATPVVSMALGYHFACFVREDGSVACVGDDESAQLGRGSAGGSSAIPVEAATSGYAAAYGGADRFVTLRPSGGGDAVFWGLRPGDPDDGPLTLTPTSLDAAFDRMANGGDFVCGLSGESLACVGGNFMGQLGVGDTDVRTSPVALGGSWLDVSAGLVHTCGIQSADGDRTLHCWGADDRGQSGGVDATVPTQVGAEVGWDEVAAGKDFTCARQGGAVYCFGNNDSGQLALPPSGADHPSPSRVSIEGAPVDDATQIASGRFHACMLRADAEAWCWGNDECGALGSGTSGSVGGDPVRVVQPIGAPRFARIAAGNHFTCALAERGALYCWGRGGERLASMSTNCTTGPPPIESPQRICL